MWPPSLPGILRVLRAFAVNRILVKPRRREGREEEKTGICLICPAALGILAVVPAFFVIVLDENADDAGGHHAGDGSAEHGPEADSRQILSASGSDRADAADLDADTGEVGEAA